MWVANLVYNRYKNILNYIDIGFIVFMFPSYVDLAEILLGELYCIKIAWGDFTIPHGVNLHNLILQ
jgi:hypothetical protein